MVILFYLLFSCSISFLFITSATLQLSKTNPMREQIAGRKQPNSDSGILCPIKMVLNCRKQYILGNAYELLVVSYDIQP